MSERGGSFWSWRFGVGLVLGAVLLVGVIAAYQKTLEAQTVGHAMELVRESQEEVPSIAQVAKAVREMKLVTVSIDTRVKVTSTETNWRGEASATVEAPVRLHYGTDLSKMDVRGIAVNAITGACIVRIPKPERIATEVFAEKEEIEVGIGWARLRSRSGEYQLGLARRQLGEQARKMVLSPEDAVKVSETTREQVKSLVEKVVGPARAVVVRIDDDAERQLADGR